MIYIEIPEGWTFVPGQLNPMALSLEDELAQNRQKSASDSTKLSKDSLRSKIDALNEMINLSPKDQLIDSAGRCIKIQNIVQDWLRTKKRTTQVTIKDPSETYGLDIKLYYKKPPDNDKEFLEYKSYRNGKGPASHTQMVYGYEKQVKFVTQKHGQFWHQVVPLSLKKLEDVESKRNAQRENRRHTGDSPKAT
ncbi:MAG: hypothetical protein Q8R79_04025 [Legionellaceae bacterium]|nr:hypothetical protein [Legionellaceae bacterium]